MTKAIAKSYADPTISLDTMMSTTIIILINTSMISGSDDVRRGGVDDRDGRHGPSCHRPHSLCFPGITSTLFLSQVVKDLLDKLITRGNILDQN